MTASRKMIVRVISRMPRASSLGVFCRAAPSTRAIILSMNVSPGLAVIRTTIRSLRTVVPPVTAHRSPPASRTTGADSPVIADSSTVATPSTTSPSPGITSPASTTTRSPRHSSVPDTCCSEPPASLRAMVCVRVFLRLSAWALPRPSAIASARLANTIVAQSHSVTETEKTLGASTDRIVVSTEPTQTTKITGERNRRRGSSLVRAKGSACQAVTARLGCAGRGCLLTTAPPRSNRGPETGSTSVRPR